MTAAEIIPLIDVTHIVDYFSLDDVRGGETSLHGVINLAPDGLTEEQVRRTIALWLYFFAQAKDVSLTVDADTKSVILGNKDASNFLFQLVDAGNVVPVVGLSVTEAASAMELAYARRVVKKDLGSYDPVLDFIS